MNAVVVLATCPHLLYLCITSLLNAILIAEVVINKEVIFETSVIPPFPLCMTKLKMTKLKEARGQRDENMTQAFLRADLVLKLV